MKSTIIENKTGSIKTKALSIAWDVALWGCDSLEFGVISSWKETWTWVAYPRWMTTISNLNTCHSPSSSMASSFNIFEEEEFCLDQALLLCFTCIWLQISAIPGAFLFWPSSSLELHHYYLLEPILSAASLLLSSKRLLFFPPLCSQYLLHKATVYQMPLKSGIN